MKIETKTKRRVYIFLTMILGILLAVITYALIENARINNLLAKGLIVDNVYSPRVASIYLIGGMLFGYVAGVRWWQLVYVEKRHWRRGKRIKK